MAKGFNKARNRQAELAKKMELAKQQHHDVTNSIETEPSSTESSSSDEDRELFQKLLDTTQGALPTDLDTDSAFIAAIKAGKKKEKLKKKKPSPPKSKEEKHPKKEKAAQRIHFESLIDLETRKELGSISAAQLVPWVPPFLNDCLIVFADPRKTSGDLRQTIKYLSSACDNLKDDNRKQKITKQVICITVDSVSEIEAWLKRSKLSSTIRIFSDPQLAWMGQYNILSNDDEGSRFPWSMTSLTIDTSGAILEQNRNVKPSHSTQIVTDTIEKLSKK